MEFHKTKAGLDFFENQFPRAVKALERIAKALEDGNNQEIKEQKESKKQRVLETRSLLHSGNSEEATQLLTEIMNFVRDGKK